MKFTKMHGCGNDYVYVNGFTEKVADKPKAVVALSDRHFGIGSDGVIFINPSQQADFEMEMYNADGTRAEMCGNGIRCVGKYVYDHGMTDKTSITVESFGKVKYLDLTVENGKVIKVKVNMGKPELTAKDVPVVSVHEQAIEEIGPYFENHERFPNRTNTEFVQVIDDSHVKMRVWERGTGETLACGTGCCATAVACVLNRLTGAHVTVQVLGGEIEIYWDQKENLVYMTGPAVTVFEGETEEAYV